MAAADGVSNQHTTDFRKPASTIGHSMEELGTMTKEMASDAVGKFQENAAKYYDQGVKRAESFERGIEKKIGENPIVALCVAAGVGLVAGAYFNRR